MFRKILVAIDGSRHSQQALKKAIELARGQQSEVLGILHVRPTVETWTWAYGFELAAFGDTYQEMLRTLEETSRELLEDAVEKAREAVGEGTQVVVHDEAGVVTSRVEAVVREGDYDVLVVGSRGMGRAAGLLLGSVSQALLAKLPCTMLVVRLEDDGEESGS